VKIGLIFKIVSLTFLVSGCAETAIEKSFRDYPVCKDENHPSRLCRSVTVQLEENVLRFPDGTTCSHFSNKEEYFSIYTSLPGGCARNFTYKAILGDRYDYGSVNKNAQSLSDAGISVERYCILENMNYCAPKGSRHDAVLIDDRQRKTIISFLVEKGPER